MRIMPVCQITNRLIPDDTPAHNPTECDLLYLFTCGMMWRERTESSAGWDLIAGLRSADPVARGLCANLLSHTRRGRLLSGKLRQPVLGFYQFPGGHGERESDLRNEMKTPYGLALMDSCNTCTLKKPGWMCHLAHDGVKSLNNVSHLTAYPGGALLFVEGQSPRGVFILCSGKVKLTTTSREGKVLMLKMAEPGAVLGLSAVIAGEPYELSAETAQPCQVNFIEREPLLRMIRSNSEMGLHSTETLSREFQAAYRDLHDLVLARSAAGNLARLLLSWIAGAERTESRELRIRSGATHEEMAQMIGSSRETVTRLLSDLKKKEFIRLEGSTLVIRDRGALEQIAA
jgi:CRP/FNR family transcriptional regulator, cyclic AMP receptor protein